MTPFFPFGPCRPLGPGNPYKETWGKISHTDRLNTANPHGMHTRNTIPTIQHTRDKGSQNVRPMRFLFLLTGSPLKPWGPGSPSSPCWPISPVIPMLPRSPTGPGGPAFELSMRHSHSPWSPEVHTQRRMITQRSIWSFRFRLIHQSPMITISFSLKP